MQQQVEVAEQPYSWRRDRRLAACVIAAALLVIAAGGSDLGAGFYTFLRIYAFGAAVVLSLLGWRERGAWLPLSAILVAILFNPIRPIRMSVDAWHPYDWAAAAWFFVVGIWPLLRQDRQRLRGWAAAICIVILLALVGIGVRGMDREDASNTMNVDENLTTTDMNATSTEMNETDINSVFADMNASDTSQTAAPEVTTADQPEAANVAGEIAATSPKGDLSSELAGSKKGDLSNELAASSDTNQP